MTQVFLSRFKKFSLLFFSFLSALAVFMGMAVVYAWTEPSQIPPAGNVAAPLNVGSVTQYKSGALGVGGAFRGYGTGIFDGNVGIGTASPAAKLQVAGDIYLGTDGGGLKTLRIYSPTVSQLAEIYRTSTQFVIDWAGGGTTLDLGYESRGNIALFGNAASGENNYLYTYGYDTGALAKKYGRFNVDAAGDFNIEAQSGEVIRFVTGGVDKVTIDNSGNVGIGTTAPTAPLDVNGQVRIRGGSPGANKVLTSDVNGLATWTTASSGLGGSGTANYVSKFTSGSALGNSQIFDNSTNVGIGTTNPSDKLDVAGVVRITSAAAPIWDTNTRLWMESGFGTRYDGYQHRFDVGNTRTEAMRINSSGNVGIGTTAPSSKLSFGSASPNATQRIALYEITSGGAFRGVGMANPSAGGYGVGIWALPSVADFPTDNNMTMFVKDGGNVGIGTTNPTSKLYVNGSAYINSSTNICPGCIHQAALATGIGEVSLSYWCDNNTKVESNLTLPGGTYGFYPQTKFVDCNSALTIAAVSFIDSRSANSVANYGTYIRMGMNNIGGGPGPTAYLYAQQRYIQASPPYYLQGAYVPLFLYVIREKSTTLIKSAWFAEDPPWESSGGNPDQIPHPFVDFLDKPLPSNLEIDFIDPYQVKNIKEEATKNGVNSLLSYINAYYSVDPADIASPLVSPQTGQLVPAPRGTVWRKLMKRSTPDLSALQSTPLSQTTIESLKKEIQDLKQQFQQLKQNP